MSFSDRDGVIWMDGKMVPWREANVHVLTHTLHYGMGVFEGVRAYKAEKGTAIFRLDDHTSRLFLSAHILGMEIPFDAETVSQAHIDSVRQLLARGADPNLRDIYGWTPLMRAVYEDRARVVQALLEQSDIQLNARNDQGATALYLAAVQGNEPVTRALLLAGADPRIGDREGRAPENVAIAAGHENIARLLKGE